MDYKSISLTIFQFMIYSFLGWVIEVIYRSAHQRRYVNAGFLFGPFLPIYGIGAFLTLLFGSMLLKVESHIIITFFIIGILLSIT